MGQPPRGPILRVPSPARKSQASSKRIIFDLRAAAREEGYTEQPAGRRTLLQDVFLGRFILEMTMIRLIAVAFALTVATSAQAMPLAPLHQADGLITQVRQACGAGMKWNNALGRCATTSARRHVRRGVVTGH